MAILCCHREAPVVNRSGQSTVPEYGHGPPPYHGMPDAIDPRGSTGRSPVGDAIKVGTGGAGELMRRDE